MVLVESVKSVVGLLVRIQDTMWENKMDAMYGMEKRRCGSKRMIAESLPWRGTSDEKALGRMAWVMMRFKREVLPALEGWWVVGGEMSSIMGLDG